jgi:hypothetical protein
LTKDSDTATRNARVADKNLARAAFVARGSGLTRSEILVLRQQLLVLRRKSPKRARLRNIDRLIRVCLSRLFPSLLDAMVIVKPETVLRWHRLG